MTAQGAGVFAAAMTARRARAFAIAFLLGALAGCAGSHQKGPEPGAGSGATSGAPPARAPAASPETSVPPPPPPNEWRNARSIKIGLAVGANKILVAGSKKWTLRHLRGGEVAQAEAGVPLRVSRAGAGAFEVSRDGETAPLWSGTPVDTLVLESSGHGYAGWSGRWYRGTFLIFTSQPSGVTLVNDVDMESYLESVLPHEIGTPPESDFEAVKAQAVAARSYTLSYLGRRAALGFDLYASVEDQVYGGIARENEQSLRALRATKGEVLVNAGEPIRALYSSACGGRTANVEDVWPWPWTPYLRSVRDVDDSGDHDYCAASANYRWREEWDAATFMAMLRQYGPQEGGALSVLAGDLLDVRVKTRARCGRVQELAITTTDGDWILRGDRTRWGLRRPGGDAILRSSFFKIGVIRDRDGKPEQVVVSGAGNGHGIGLCQFGALGMARAGKGYREILSHYYKSTSIVRVG